MLLQDVHHARGLYLDLGDAAEVAAQHDDLPCFLYAHANGAFTYKCPMKFAAARGALSILDYCFQHKDDAIWRSHHPYAGGTWEKALCAAAAFGHLACVRFLHERGARLWDCVEVTSDFWFTPRGIINKVWLCGPANPLLVPESPQLADSLWGVMRYGKMHGAPLPYSAVCVLRERRARAREVLLCFHCAARLSRAVGKHGHLWGLMLCFHGASQFSRAVDKHRHLWGVMARVPLDVVYIILVKAELELEDTFNLRAPRGMSASSG